MVEVRRRDKGFRPSAEEVAYYVKVREVFAEGLKRGMASVPIEGKMIDIPVVVRAERLIRRYEAIKEREAKTLAASR